MASRLPMPKVGMTKSTIVSAFLLILVVSGYIAASRCTTGDLLLDADGVDGDVPESGAGLGQGPRDVTAAAVPEEDPVKPLSRPQPISRTSSSTRHRQREHPRGATPSPNDAPMAGRRLTPPDRRDT